MLSLDGCLHSQNQFDEKKKTRLTSPEVRAATTLKARSDLGRLPFLLLDQEKDERRLCSKGGYMVDDNFTICQNIDS